VIACFRYTRDREHRVIIRSHLLYLSVSGYGKANSGEVFQHVANLSSRSAAFVGIFWITVVIINFFGVKGYGEAEFVFSIIKVIAVRTFLLITLNRS
jgi:amino acid permease